MPMKGNDYGGFEMVIGPPVMTPEGTSPVHGEYMTERAISGLIRLGTVVKILSVLAFALMITGAVSIFFFELTTTTWFSTFYTWLVIIPLFILFTIWPTLYIAYKRNIIGSTYSIFIGVYGILAILLLALMIWVLVEWFWYCPTFKPDVCTNGSTSVIEMGFMIYAIVVIIETVMIFTFLFVMWSLRNYFRKIESGMSTLSRAEIAALIIRTMYEGDSHHITGIGRSHMISLKSDF